MKKKILFVCIHNSARSQMAEAFVNESCREDFEAHSAGLEPGKMNPVVVEVMNEIGYDLSHNETKSVEAMLATKREFDFVVTVCDEASAEECPVFPGGGQRLHWGFPDPSAIPNSDPEAKIQRTREIRDQIRAKVGQFCASQCASKEMATA